MSPMTAKLIARDILAKVKTEMQGTPDSWLTAVDERAHARRYLQTLTYLETCYDLALKVLPLTVYTDESMQLIQKLFVKLRDSWDALSSEMEEILGETADKQLATVPKYYYTELRSRMDCMVPEPPAALDETSSLNLLCCEAVGCLRNAERSGLLASKRGQEVPADAWSKKSTDLSKVAADIVSTLIMVYGEERTEAVLLECLKHERFVVEEMLDGSKGRVRFGTAPASESPVGEEEEEEDEDEGDGDFCMVQSKPIFIVSDCTGESAEKTVLCSLGQFGHCFDRSAQADITTHRFVTRGKVEKIVEKARDRGAFIVFTLVEPVANQEMVECCDRHGVEHHDLWSPLLAKLEGYLHTTRQGIPGRRQFADEKYMQMVECIEYTRTLDDGVQPHRWKEADMMIVGPSRSGKTPLSFFMAQRGFKVANYPIVPGEDMPKELFTFDQNRIFALDIEPQKLVSIRNTRMKTLKMGTKTAYAQLSKVRQEVTWCKNLYRKQRWTVLDTSDSGIEETSARIMKQLDEVGGGYGARNTDNPSAI